MAYLQSHSDGLLVLPISASTQRYHRRKAEQVLDIAIAPGNSPIRLDRGYIKVCQLFADLQRNLYLGEAPYKTYYDQVKRQWVETCQSLADGYL